MFRFILLVLFMTSAFASLARTRIASIEDSQAVVEATRDYIESQHKSSKEQMERALHPNLVKRTYWQAQDGSEFIMELDTVIVAIGNDSNPLIPQTTPELEVNKWGNIVVDENTMTSLDRVYAGGDIVLGAATVILAMGEGRRAAVAINELLA